MAICLQALEAGAAPLSPVWADLLPRLQQAEPAAAPQVPGAQAPALLQSLRRAAGAPTALPGRCVQPERHHKSCGQPLPHRQSCLALPRPVPLWAAPSNQTSMSLCGTWFSVMDYCPEHVATPSAGACSTRHFASEWHRCTLLNKQLHMCPCTGVQADTASPAPGRRLCQAVQHLLSTILLAVQISVCGVQADASGPPSLQAP